MNDFEIPCKLHSVDFWFFVLLCSRMFYRERERENRKIHENHIKSTNEKNDYVVGIMNMTVQLLSLGLSLAKCSLELTEGGRVRNHHIIPSCFGRNPSSSPIVHVQGKKETERHNKIIKRHISLLCTVSVLRNLQL